MEYGTSNSGIMGRNLCVGDACCVVTVMFVTAVRLHLMVGVIVRYYVNITTTGTCCPVVVVECPLLFIDPTLGVTLLPC